MSGPAGSDETRRFYDEVGWTAPDGTLRDLDLFGVKEDGPIRRELYGLYQQRVRDAVASAGAPVDLLECGCGGSPEASLLEVCSSYTGVDFSVTGLEVAAAKLADSPVPSSFQEADVCDLPFEDAHFDAVYSARMIYHIADVDAQARAIAEMMRVTRPGGVVVVVTANPFPVLFPERTLKRLVARTPVLGPLADRLRPPPPLPYEPLSYRWFRRQVGDRGSVEVISNGFATVAFNQNVTEFEGFGRLRWRAIRATEHRFPRLSAYLGNYAQLTIRIR